MKITAQSSLLSKVGATEVMDKLLESEAADRYRLEQKVELAFYDAASALRELRDRRLYRDTHKTFEEYCQIRFNYSSDTAYLKIAAADVYDNIQRFLPTIGRQIPMPTNERQLRDIAKAGLEPQTQAIVWVKSVDEVDGKVPSGRVVKENVKRQKQQEPSNCVPASKASILPLGDEQQQLKRTERDNADRLEQIPSTKPDEPEILEDNQTLSKNEVGKDSLTMDIDEICTNFITNLPTLNHKYIAATVNALAHYTNHKTFALMDEQTLEHCIIDLNLLLSLASKVQNQRPLIT